MKPLVVDAADTRAAAAFVQARLAARALPDYPGPLPADLDQAYRRQDHAIGLWPDVLAGWKVGKLPDEWAARLGEERLVGPVFARRLQMIRPDESVELGVIAGGFAAIEAEYVFVLASDAPADQLDWTPTTAAGLVAAMHLGIELAGSPLATINQLGPAVVVSDFGNNAGVLLGPVVPDWQAADPAGLRCETWIDGTRVGIGGAASLSGGPLAALAFALARCARRGRPLRAGMIVSTGASTGIHDIRAGQQGEVRFSDGTLLRCRAVPALPANGAGAC